MISVGGIYCIHNIISNKYYIGKTVNFYNRKRYHFSVLNNNKHDNTHLQRAYNKYGKDAFVFIILENIDDVALLSDREQSWVDNYRAMKFELYNQKIINTDSAIGNKNWLGKKQTVEHINNRVVKVQKAIKQIDILTNQVVCTYESAIIAERNTGVNHSHIAAVCRNKRKSAGKYKWEYV